MNLNYDALRPMDCVCIASPSFIGRMIRLRTASLVNLNPFAEFVRLKMANHVGVIVQHSEKFWIAEMVATGLKINSLNDYLRKGSRDKIVSIRRLHNFDIAKDGQSANKLLIDWAHKTVQYDYAGIAEFLGLRRDNPREYYCSELAEIVANRYGATWDKWQLSRSGKKSRIAPCEIQYGKTCEEVKGWKS